MTDNHPITPSEEVVDGWEGEWHHYNGRDTYEMFMAKQAARWGADQELEACCEWVEKTVPSWAPHTLNEQLRAARRPKPLSLKERALEALEALPTPAGQVTADRLDTIRRALEQLND